MQGGTRNFREFKRFEFCEPPEISVFTRIAEKE